MFSRVLVVPMRAGVVAFSLLLAGCGAMWDSIDPPADARDRVAFYIAKDAAYLDWRYLSGSDSAKGVYLAPSAVLKGSDIEMAAAMIDPQRQYFVGVRVGPRVADRLAAATAGAIGDYMALVWDARLIDVIPIDKPITMGLFALPVRDEAAALALAAMLDPHRGQAR